MYHKAFTLQRRGSGTREVLATTRPGGVFSNIGTQPDDRVENLEFPPLRDPFPKRQFSSVENKGHTNLGVVHRDGKMDPPPIPADHA
jgi:hypothetical protein